MKQKIKNLLNSMEEKYVFPIGRRTWQIMSFLGLFVLLLGMIWLIVNLTPTSRDSVNISKEEVKNNAIDTQAIEKSISDCTAKEVQDYLDSIKVLTPTMEWKNLGEMEDEVYYLEDEFGNYIYDEESYSLKVGIKKVFRLNSKAIPNIFESIYKDSYIDSIDFCSKKSIVEKTFTLLKQFDKSFIAEQKVSFIRESANLANILTQDQINTSILINEITNSKIKSIATVKGYGHFVKCVDEATSGDYSIIELNASKNLVSSHLGLDKVKKSLDLDDYLDLVKITGNTEIQEDDEITSAAEGFIDDIKFYDENGLVRSYKKYMSLYEEKLNRAIDKQIVKKAEKAENREVSLMALGAGFMTVVVIAIILLLFSIQSILKKREDKE
jgi:hypothetical protein